MALSREQFSQCKRTVEQYLENHRPPRQVRGEVDYRARIRGQSVEIYRIGPGGTGRPGAISRNGVAKATFVKSRETWKLYAQGEGAAWSRFPPEREFPSLDAALKEVERDRGGHFYG